MLTGGNRLVLRLVVATNRLRRGAVALRRGVVALRRGAQVAAAVVDCGGGRGERGARHPHHEQAARGHQGNTLTRLANIQRHRATPRRCRWALRLVRDESTGGRTGFYIRALVNTTNC
eukprot:2576223-Pyramimonas_sp.AAC.1